MQLAAVTCIAALASVALALPREVQVQGRYRPSSPATTVSPMANITNFLGYMVFKGLPEEDKIVSPISLLEVLFMLYFAASGSTKAELDSLLRFRQYGLGTEEKIVHEITYEIYKWKNTKGEIMDLTRSYTSDQIYEEYIQRLKTMFDGEAFTVDFAKKSHEVTEGINKWISEKTSGNIARFFKEDLDEYTKLVLISIITFKFNWKDQFTPGLSREGLFYNGGKEEAYAMYMYKDTNVEVGINEAAHSITLRLPYENTDYDMYIIGPYGKVGDRPATVADVEDFLWQTKTYESLLKTEKKPDDTFGVEVPRFVVSSEVDLKSVLSRLGVQSLFTPEADLSNMSPGKLHVSSIKQAGYAKIDEEGTEAGVVTAATASSRMVPNRLAKTFTFNKPFLFLIRNNRLHLDLFLGKISNVPKDNF